MPMITAEQIRASRAILQWSIDELASKTGISISTLQRIEKGEGYPRARIDNIERIRKAFENTEKVSFPDEKTISINAYQVPDTSRKNSKPEMTKA